MDKLNCMYKSLIRPILFLFQPETIHKAVFAALRFTQVFPFGISVVRTLFNYESSGLRRKVFGIDFPNPIGLAAGMDKDAEVYEAFGAMGFGFVEIGTVTPKPQPGNEKPRVFRLPENKALINRMGFNNLGVLNAVRNLRKRKSDLIIGGNIGKNKITPNEDAVSDYLFSFNELFDYVDYFVVNVSSPNTPNLRELQDKEPLTGLLEALQKINHSKSVPKPILLKIAPDLGESQLDDIISIVKHTRIDGIVATNTTISRSGLAYSDEHINSLGAGGLSGLPLRDRSTEVIRYLSEKSEKTFPIIAAGGVMSPEDALEKLNAGASLVQIYTGFIYEGPGFVKRINQFLDKR